VKKSLPCTSSFSIHLLLRVRRRRRRRRRLLLLANFSQLSYLDRLKLAIPFFLFLFIEVLCALYVFRGAFFPPLFFSVFFLFLILIEIHVWMYVCMFYNFCNLGKRCEAPELISFAKFA
jgi:hypothetical protein